MEPQTNRKSVGATETLAPSTGRIPPRPEPVRVKRKRPVIRRRPDRSQRWRHLLQIAFLLLNVALGFELYFWVVSAGRSGGASAAGHPAGVEGWLPIAGLMNLKYWIVSGRIPAIHPAAMFLLITFLAIAFLLRKAFCSWLCPVGTLSEGLWRLGKKIFGRNLRLPRGLDLPLRGMKYLLLGFFVWAVAGMSAAAIDGFMRSPYGVIADVKMLDFFRFLGTTGIVVIGFLVIGSILVKDFWCRYLCPYGALLGIVSLFSPTAVRRDSQTCIDCGKCAKACPAGLPVDKLDTVRSVECSACLSCVTACPVADALDLSLPRLAGAKGEGGPGRKGRTVRGWAVAAAIAVIFVSVVGFAKVTGHWQSQVPQSTYQQLVPNAAQVQHPMP